MEGAMLVLAFQALVLWVAKLLEAVQRRHGHVSGRPLESNRRRDSGCGKRYLNFSAK